MLTSVTNVLAGLIGVGSIFICVRVFWAPQAAVGFGIPGHAGRGPQLPGPAARQYPARHGQGATAAVMLAIRVLLLVA
ncbi:hypothetical protein E1293_10920 [Actinomadura darangshiensis]|uniref:Uncharacterized protein n=1 Tax=Actinomadura darangshiensis TaxID=705336 RepID=A0A4R5BKR6_9ACTN|nr:hypothetical protein [Actinomadura darangshiensis]TDD85610.1 hypothetical protein E1293_10920 [Actinomadura darangshiensis]